MKKLFIAFVTFLSISEMFAQCDVAQSAFSISPASVAVGQTAELKFSIKNLGSAGCAYAPGALKVVVSIPKRPFDFQSFVSNQHGDFFDWSFDETERILVGINHKALSSNEVEKDVTVKLVGKTAGKATATLNLEITDGSDNAIIENDPSFGSLEIAAAPLPVKLEFFKGESNIKGNLLSWKTSAESNFSHFELEKSSNALEFNFLAKVITKQNSSGSAYHYLDERINTGMLPGASNTSFFADSFYRLKLVDVDGTYSYSNIIFIEDNDKLAHVGEFYPNPTMGAQAEIDIITSKAENWKIIASDLKGKIIYQQDKNLTKGLNRVNIKLPETANGEILFRLENKEGVAVKKLIKN